MSNLHIIRMHADQAWNLHQEILNNISVKSSTTAQVLLAMLNEKLVWISDIMHLWFCYKKHDMDKKTILIVILV